MPAGEREGTPVVVRGIVRACRRLDRRGLVAGSSGNASVRLPDGSVWITASGTAFGFLRPRDVVRLAPGGWGGQEPRPSSEWRLHAAIYAVRPDVGAVVHTHSPVASAYAVAGRPIEPLTTEAAAFLGTVPVVPYAEPGSEELARAVATTAHNTGAAALLLERHGVVALGVDLQTACAVAEWVEEAAVVGLAVARLRGAAMPEEGEGLS